MAANAAARMRATTTNPRLEVLPRESAAAREILTPGALEFLGALHTAFESRRQELLSRRVARQQHIDNGARPDFLPETRGVREAHWRVAPLPHDLVDRRVEITGPVDRKMIINALNSGANVFMADFEDANAPTWDNNLAGQHNLRDAVRRAIEFTSEQGKHYTLNADVATLMVRPRGWHLNEKHVLVNGVEISGSLFDFGLFLFHNATEQLARNTGPYFYLPKLENHLEARLWNDVFVFAQDRLGLPHGTIRATVLIENILAAFEMDEILYELRDHSAGLNCGRWDYIFSFIKTFRADPAFVLPDRGAVGMDRHFLHSYVELLIKTCHRRGVHAMGGMAAQIPVKRDSAANDAAIAKVTQDKLREVKAGHDGTWVAHPGLVPVARGVFDANMPAANQIDRSREEVVVTAGDLLAVPEGSVTREGLRHNVDVGIRYLESWLRGSGCVPIYDLMEDAATAEISRSQVWQWVRHAALLDDGETITPQLVRDTIQRELYAICAERDPVPETGGPLDRAAELFTALTTDDAFTEWLTAVAYMHLD